MAISFSCRAYACMNLSHIHNYIVTFVWCMYNYIIVNSITPQVHAQKNHNFTTMWQSHSVRTGAVYAPTWDSSTTNWSRQIQHILS